MKISQNLKNWLILLGFLVSMTLPNVFAQDTNQDTLKKEDTNFIRTSNFSISHPRVIRKGEKVKVILDFSDDEVSQKSGIIEVNGKKQEINIKDGEAEILMDAAENPLNIEIKIGDITSSTSVKVAPFPIWLSVLPPLIAILLALIFREVVVSLFVGIFLGAAILGYYNQESLVGIFSGFLRVLDTYILLALNDGDHLSIILFSLLIGGMVAIISRNGGMMGIVTRISGISRTPVTGQFATWLLGLVIFFDDYANTLVVGNTMRSVTDSLKISREKLSYIVDSTAAPVAALAFVTTWIGAELGYIEDGIKILSQFPEGQSAYSIFLQSLNYSFYPILTLLFILMLIFSKRDFGPMLKAERRARTTGQVSRTENSKGGNQILSHFQPISGIPIRATNAIIPVVVLIIGVLWGLLATGWSDETWDNSSLGFFQKLSQTIGDSDSYKALLWASLSAVSIAIILTVGRRIMNVVDTIETMTNGIKAMLGAIIILILAWSLQRVTEDLYTADFLTDFLGNLSPLWVPAITFLLAALVSFSTGSSWGTMAILYPLLIPLSWRLSIKAGIAPDLALAYLYNTVSAVLAGSVLGDHCSPISDTTILSSLSCSCDHIDHVRTQLPYALVVGGVSLFIGTIPASLGVPVWICYPIAIGILWGIVKLVGKPILVNE